MKNGILRVALLGVVASASFSLTPAASLAATATNTCAVVNPAKAASKNAAAPDVDPAAAADKLLLGGH